jgi:anhydro-N-acetylmuramic acid kinase
MTSLMRVVGLMSGTSLDGVDAALIETDGKSIARPIGAFTIPYADGFRADLRALLDWAQAQSAPHPLPPAHAETEAALTQRHIAAVKQILARETAELVGFHGQTVAHRPDRGWTWQVGDAAKLAQSLGLPVVYDFRSADVAAGGQGAPLVPAYHHCLAACANLPRPLAILNIGGVANLTWIGEGADDLMAFDTGPGNALLDDWMFVHSGAPMDHSGATAAAGAVRWDIVNAVLDHPWFDAPAPKSLDRNDFSIQPLRGLELADGAATLVALTVEAVRLAIGQLPKVPRHWLVTGGGRHNSTMMRVLGERLQAPVFPVESAGWDGDALEAQAFAYLAARSVLGLPISYPGVTGVPTPLTGGRLVKPRLKLSPNNFV